MFPKKVPSLQINKLKLFHVFLNCRPWKNIIHVLKVGNKTGTLRATVRANWAVP